MKNYARSIPEEIRQRDRFRTSHDEMFQLTEDQRVDQSDREQAQGNLQHELSKMIRKLDDREQQIIQLRFGLTADQHAQTLQQVGDAIGVTKERVRQIEAQALSKLRREAAVKRLEILE
jgi:RNA polymerase primary sigma factor/RNA polymerase sigma factor